MLLAARRDEVIGQHCAGKIRTPKHWFFNVLERSPGGLASGLLGKDEVTSSNLVSSSMEAEA